MSLLFDGPPPSARAEVVTTIGTLCGVCKGSVWSPRAGPLLMSIPGGIENVRDAALRFEEVRIYAVGEDDPLWLVLGVRRRRGVTTYHELCGFSAHNLDDKLMACAAQKQSAASRVHRWLKTARTEALLS